MASMEILQMNMSASVLIVLSAYTVFFLFTMNTLVFWKSVSIYCRLPLLITQQWLKILLPLQPPSVHQFA